MVNLQCKLQKYAQEFGITTLPFDGGWKKSFPIDDSSPSIIRNNNKCILCHRCIGVCSDVQTVDAIGLQNRGAKTVIKPPFDLNMNQSNCVNCGQCVIACPVGALSEKSHTQDVIAALNKAKLENKHIVAQTAPSIRAALGECFDLPAGTAVTGKMVSALRRLGFDKVFDTDLGADITIIEEATEFAKRFQEGKQLPMITTCCPAWIKFAEQFYFEQLNHMSSCKSPQSMLASLIKTYYAKKNNLDPKDIILVSIMPCTAKKFEIEREEFLGDTDYVLTTVELANVIKRFNIDFNALADEEFDHPLGESTGASVIFGRTGGVMEAALRSAADFISGEDVQEIEYESVRGTETLKEATISLAGKEVKIAVVHTLGEARTIMDAIRAGTCPYHFVEVMACYGGCVGGGGQPRNDNPDIVQLRANALNSEDTNKVIRKSHKNPTALKLYDEYLGEFGGERAHEILHTSYTERDSL